MKMIVVYIEPSALNRVKKILYRNDINRFSVSDAWGHSHRPGVLESYRGVEMEIDLSKKIRVDIAVNDDFKDLVIKVLLAEGRAGKLKDGKIFVVPIEESYRLKTGEEGPLAIG